ncbi:MAG: hypothetical protein H7831_08425 [Magnetococcus sp. WYHC-3]
MEANGSYMASITRAIRDIGFPAVIVIFLLAVLTGLIPTSLMDSLGTIKLVHANQKEEARIQERQLQVLIITCEFVAQTKDDAKKCHPL